MNVTTTTLSQRRRRPRRNRVLSHALAFSILQRINNKTMNSILARPNNNNDVFGAESFFAKRVSVFRNNDEGPKSMYTYEDHEAIFRLSPTVMLKLTESLESKTRILMIESNACAFAGRQFLRSWEIKNRMKLWQKTIGRVRHEAIETEQQQMSPDVPQGYNRCVLVRGYFKVNLHTVIVFLIFHFTRSILPTLNPSNNFQHSIQQKPCSEKKTVTDWRTDGQTHPLTEMQEGI